MKKVKVDNIPGLDVIVDDETFFRMVKIGLAWDPDGDVPLDLFEAHRTWKLEFRYGEVYLMGEVSIYGRRLRHWVVTAQKYEWVVQRNGLLLDFTISNLGSRGDHKAARDAVKALPVMEVTSPNVAWLPQLQRYTVQFYAEDDRWRKVTKGLRLFQTEAEAEAYVLKRQVRKTQAPTDPNANPSALQQDDLDPTDPNARWENFIPPLIPVSDDEDDETPSGVAYEKTRKVPLYLSEAPTKESWGKVVNLATARLVHLAILYFCKSGDSCDLPQGYVGKELLGLSIPPIRLALQGLEQSGIIRVRHQYTPPKRRADGGVSSKRRASQCTLLGRQRKGSYGLFPGRLFDNPDFRSLNETAKFVLVTLYMLAEGADVLDFFIQELMDATFFTVRKSVLDALKALHCNKIIQLDNPCGRYRPYETTRISIRFLW